MAKQQLIAGLDIGTSNTKILVASRKKGESDFKVVYQAQEPSFGIRRGVVVDTDKAARIIQILLNKVKTEGNQRINSVCVNIGGSHIFCASAQGMVAVSKADRKISQEDVERVIQSARTVSMSSNEEIIEVFPREFVVDGKGGIKEVEGMQGQRLEIKASLVGCFSPYKGNLVQAVTNADVKIGDMYPSVLSSAGAVLTPKQKELGVAVLDIGAGTTELAVFEEGNLIHLAVLPIGSSNITNDIAILLKTDIDTAELVKVKSGTCVFKGNDKREKMEVGDEGEVLVFSHRMLANIIGARMSEIFKEVQKELKTIGKQGNLPAGIVLTGGGANVPKIIELARKEFKLPSRIGRPLGFSNLDDSLNFASACGLVLKAAENCSGMVSKGGGIGGIFRKFAQTFIP